jgi:hypothetical protein
MVSYLSAERWDSAAWSASGNSKVVPKSMTISEA